jgi:hypothetical protein
MHCIYEKVQCIYNVGCVDFASLLVCKYSLYTIIDAIYVCISKTTSTLYMQCRGIKHLGRGLLFDFCIYCLIFICKMQCMLLFMS